MSELDLLKLLQLYGDETEIADFTPDELRDMLDALAQNGEPIPLTKEAFKKRYFEFYDDVKDKSLALEKQDW